MNLENLNRARSIVGDCTNLNTLGMPEMLLADIIGYIKVSSPATVEEMLFLREWRSDVYADYRK